MILAAGSPFDPVYNFFGAILAFLYSIVPSLGVCIILLTILVMLVMFPLTAKQAKSMLAMQRAQPEIKKLQAKYKHDRAKLNEEMMAFYQENKINPLAGCLPLLVQMPVFFALYRVMEEPYKHIPKSSDLFAAFCTGPAGKLHTVKCNVPKLHLPTAQNFLGMDLSQHATAVSGGFLDALPYFILVGLVVLTGFMQARQSRRNAPNMNSQMAMVTSVLPIAFGLFSLQFPAGLVLYFLISNLWRLGQQEIIMRKITRPGQAALAASKTDDVIDVEGGDTSAFPRAAGGLRKLFQIPAAANGEEPAAETGNGTKNGESSRASGAAKGAAKGATKGAASKAQPTKASPSKSAQTKGAQTKGTPARSGSGTSSTGSSSASGSRRRNNKKRKRR
jgi:YidC/Oxa1 family membrane protein insertase